MASHGWEGEVNFLDLGVYRLHYGFLLQMCTDGRQSAAQNKKKSPVNLFHHSRCASVWVTNS